MNRVSHSCSVPLLKCLHVSLTWFRLALKGALPKSTGPHPRSAEALTPNSLEISQTPVKLRPQRSAELPQAGELQVPTSPAPFPLLARGMPRPSCADTTPPCYLRPLYSKTRFQWKLGVLAPVSSSASGSVEGTGPQSDRGRPRSFVPIVMHLDAPKEPYDLYFYAPDAWVPSHIATKQPPPTPPLPPKLPPPPRGGRPQRLEPLSPATLPNNFL